MKNKVLFTACVLMLVFAVAGCGKSKLKAGETYLEEGSFEEAESAFAEEIGNEKNLVKAYRGEGIALMQEGRYDEAIAAFKNALSESTGKISDIQIDITYYLAKAQSLNGNYEDAITTYTNLVEYDPDNYMGYFERGCVYVSLNKVGNALSDFDEAIDYSDDDFDLYIKAYEICSNAGYEQASKYLTDAKEALKDLKESSREYSYNAGRIAYYQGHFDDALEYFDKAKDKAKNDSYIYIADIYMTEKDYKNANEVLLDYLEFDKTNSKVYNALGISNIALGNFEDAVNYLEEGLQYAPLNIWKEMMSNQVVALEKLYEYDKAYEKAAQLYSKFPKDESIKKEYEFLKTR